jgi:CheY-like chemotaxis protein
VTPAAGDRYVMADRQRLAQILLNLLANAVKYNRDEGSVDVACLPAGSDMLRIAVHDTGPGIAADQIPRLFSPFDRLGAEQTGIEGTGLGLALARRLTEVMGGRIGVESTVAAGSTFWVELPEVEGPLERHGRVAGEGSAPAFPALSGTRTVLYIEDNLPNVELIEQLLGRWPQVRLLSATYARLGLELARQHRPDLILLDLHLPDLDGGAVLDVLRSEPSTRDIPVVVVSADATPGQIERLLARGAKAYLTKPLDVPRFLQTLSDLLGAE